MDRTEAMLCKYLYWPDIRDVVRREVSNCDTCQRTKRSNKKYGKLPSRLAEEIPWNKICVDLIGSHVIRHKGKKENLHLKSVTVINPITRWFEVVQYDDKRAITIADLVETMWMSRYPRPIEITYDQGKEFICREFRKLLIETEYGITAKPSNSGNPIPNAILQRIHQVLVDLVQTFNVQQTYVEENDSSTGILAAAAFAIRSTTSRQKNYSPVKLIFGRDIILPIKHRVDW